MHIRLVEKSDALALIELMHQLDRETSFMLLEPDERRTTVQEQAVIIQSFQNAEKKVMFVASQANQIYGFIVGVGQVTRRTTHSMSCVLGVRQSFTGKGIGSQLLKSLESWAIQNGITRLELTVMCHNDRAKRLYESTVS